MNEHAFIRIEKIDVVSSGCDGDAFGYGKLENGFDHFQTGLVDAFIDEACFDGASRPVCAMAEARSL